MLVILLWLCRNWVLIDLVRPADPVRRNKVFVFLEYCSYSTIEHYTQANYSYSVWLARKRALVAIHFSGNVSVVASLSVWILLVSLTEYTYTDRKVCLLTGSPCATRKIAPCSSELGVLALLTRVRGKFFFPWLLFVSARYLVDPASSHMLVSKIKPCMSKYKPN